MIRFHQVMPADRQAYEKVLFDGPERGCEYSFVNLSLWGIQRIALVEGCVAFFSHFNGRSIYPYPIGKGNKKAAVEAILQDAREREIPCRLTGLTEADREELEGLFPEKFCFRTDRDGSDYVYSIHDLADLKGRKFQKKRNHFNRFQAAHPDYRVEELTSCNISLAQHMINDWYYQRLRQDPEGDYLLENIAMAKAFRNYSSLDMEGILLSEGDRVLAVAMGSLSRPDTVNIHFEKAREDVDGAYSAVNCAFARHLRLKYPQVKYLNREDDMGVEGLRKAKLSYNPHHMIHKYWACLKEEIYGD